MKTFESKIINGSRIQASTVQVSCEVDDEAIIMNLHDGIYYGLNPVGARVWNLLQEPRTIEQLQAILLEEYEVEPEICREQVLALLEDLANSGLVEILDGNAE
jgi:hypothetical protein